MTLKNKLLDGMVTFVNVVKSGSFTGAADDSGHSTSYISKEVSKLESRLGTRLLHRTTRSLRLTPEGELYFQVCQQIVEDAELAERTIAGIYGEPRGLLRVSCPISYGLTNISPILSRFTDQFPQIKLDLDLNDRKVDLIADGFDVVIRATGQLEDSSVISRRISEADVLVLASPAYIEKHGQPQHPRDLVQHKIISYSYSKQPGVWTFKTPNGDNCDVHLDVNVFTNNARLQIELGIAGQGIFRLPRFALSNELTSGALIELFEDWPKPTIGVYMVYPSRKHMSPKVRSFIDFIIEQLGDR